MSDNLEDHDDAQWANIDHHSLQYCIYNVSDVPRSAIVCNSLLKQAIKKCFPAWMLFAWIYQDNTNKVTKE